MDELTETLTAQCDMIVLTGALAMDDWQRRISINPEVLVGKPVIAGTRIAVELIVERLGRGWTEKQILEQYDHITADDIHACLMYAAEMLKSERVYPIPA